MYSSSVSENQFCELEVDHVINFLNCFLLIFFIDLSIYIFYGICISCDVLFIRL